VVETKGAGQGRPPPPKCLEKKNYRYLRKNYIKKKKKMLMLARPLLITKGKKKKITFTFTWKNQPSKKILSKKKKNQQQSLNAHLLRKRNGRTEQFCEKKKIMYLSGETLELLHKKTNNQKPLNQELRLQHLFLLIAPRQSLAL
jgi:hypothetical protein